MREQVETYEKVISDNIKISPFELVQLLDCSYSHSLDDHAYFWFKGVISEENKEVYLNQMKVSSKIRVSKSVGEGQELIFFEGYLQDLQIINRDNVYYLEGKAVSPTILLDLEKRSRSFQNVEADYLNLISEVLLLTPDAWFIDTLSEEKAAGSLLIQYEETDWQFIRRLAARFGGHLAAVAQMDQPRFYFGLPELRSKGVMEAFNYQVNIDIQGVRELLENTDYAVSETGSAQYTVESGQMYWLGDYVEFQNQYYLVADVKRKLNKGVLVNQYLLAHGDSLVCLPLPNERIKGSSLKGIVAAVKEDKVLVSLDIDKAYGGKAEYWFPYSTSYTSDNNIGWYMMPEIGDRIRVHCPTGNERDAYALASIREDQGQGDYLNPDIKTLKNKYGKTITLEPDKITISGNGTQIILSDDQGVVVKSDKGIQINGKSHIQVHGKEILMDAADQIKLSVSGNSITVDDQIVLNGTEVKMN